MSDWLIDWKTEMTVDWSMHTFPTKMILLPFQARAFFQHQREAEWRGGVLFSLLLFRAHTLVHILMLVKKKELLSPPAMKKYYHANMKNSSLFLALVIVFTTSLPGLRRYRWQLCHILVKEWISWLSTFLSLMSCLT